MQLSSPKITSLRGRRESLCRRVLMALVDWLASTRTISPFCRCANLATASRSDAASCGYFCRNALSFTSATVAGTLAAASPAMRAGNVDRAPRQAERPTKFRRVSPDAVELATLSLGDFMEG